MVMLIMTVAMAVIVPSLTNSTRAQGVNDTAAVIVSLCNYAHSQSISEGRPFRLNVDAAAGAFWLSAQTAGQFNDVGTEFGQRYRIEDGMRIQTDLPQREDGTYVTFNLNGRIDPAPVSVQVSNSGGVVANVTCESPTELFHIVEKRRP